MTLAVKEEDTCELLDGFMLENCSEIRVGFDVKYWRVVDVDHHCAPTEEETIKKYISRLLLLITVTLTLKPVSL